MYANASLYEADPASGTVLRSFPLGLGRYNTESSPDGRWFAASNVEGGRRTRIWDVKTGLPVRHFSEIKLRTLGFTPDSRLLLCGSSDEYVAWNTATWERAYTIRRGATGGGHGGITFSADAGLGAISLSANAVRIFELATGAELATLESPLVQQIHHIAFSPDASLLLAGTDEGIRVWDVESMRRKLSALNLDWPEVNRAAPIACASPREALPTAAAVPPRAPDCPPRLIDLSSHYNSAFTEFSFFSQMEGNDLSSLRAGVQMLAGTSFDVRGAVQLSGRVGLLPAPTAVSGIALNQQCRLVHFVHSALLATSTGVSKGTPVAEYVVHYADGMKENVPVLNLVNIADWWASPGQPYRLDANTTTAWHAPNAASSASRCDVYLYKSTWTNPRPGVTITTIDFRSAGTSACPFLVAITLE